MKIIKILWMAGVYFCVGTVISLAAGLAILWKQGALGEEKIFRLVAVIQDVDVDAIEQEIIDANKPPDADQVAFEDIQNKRAEKNLNLDLKGRAIEKGYNELKQLQSELQGDWERYSNLTAAFREELEQKQDDVIANGRESVRRILEISQPKLAKDQIVRILKEDSGPDSQAMADVVRIFKAAQPDKIKKIVGEFKTEEEKNQLHEILRKIRLGEPEISLIRNTQGQLPGK